MSDDNQIYKQAIKRIDELVEEVLERCEEVADENHYEKEWVLDQFRIRFNKAKRNSE